MAGMTDTAFRRLVKRHGGCGLVVTEMVSSEGLVRGIDRTLEYAEYTEEERPISIQIFGGDPEKMAAAAQIVEGMGADIVDVNMGCPVPKIAKHNAGCSLMREPAHARQRHRRDGEGGEDSRHREDARRLERSGRATRRCWRGWSRTRVLLRSQSTGGPRNRATAACADWDLVAAVADRPDDSGLRQRRLRRARNRLSPKLRAGIEGVLVGRGSAAQSVDSAQAEDLRSRPRDAASHRCRNAANFCSDYIELLRSERMWDGNRNPQSPNSPIRNRVTTAGCINKLRALGSYYTKGLDNGSHLRTAINTAQSLPQLQALDH